MERVKPTQAQIVGLAAALARRDAPSAPIAAPAPEQTAEVQAQALQRERERVLAQARRDGHAEGLAHAEEELAAARLRIRDEIEQSCADRIEQLELARDGLRQLSAQIGQRYAEHEAELRSAAVEIAYAAVLRVLGDDPDAARRGLTARICEQLLAEHRQRPAVLRVGPEDLAAVAEGLAGNEELRVVADSFLRPGECRLETRKGSYDTRLEDRLETLKRTFLAALRAEDER